MSTEQWPNKETYELINSRDLKPLNLKSILYSKYDDLNPQEKSFYTLNQEKLEINTCEKCTFIDSTYELFWDSDYLLPDTKDKTFSCLCECCYEEVGGSPQ